LCVFSGLERRERHRRAWNQRFSDFSLALRRVSPEQKADLTDFVFELALASSLLLEQPCAETPDPRAFPPFPVRLEFQEPFKSENREMTFIQ
jgi:hypothetical protein